ncbi:esterase [Lithospermum erythrorhizon]|uniref:Esterase n=1 Tax=Lithospermum erythrorhizon TaxID=34254 RepID=A0AAV3PQG3_LITER
MAGHTRPHFILFGSSIVQFSFSHEGWGAILADLYSRKVISSSYRGWNSRRALEVLDKVFPKDAIVQPSLVILYFGGNDASLPHPSGIGPHVPLDVFVENMKKIALHLKSLSDSTRVIFLSCPPVNEEQVRETMGKNVLKSNVTCKMYSDACVELCHEMDVKVVDLFNVIRRHNGWLSTCFTDGVHLTSEGSKVVVEEILKVLSDANWEPSLHWKSMPTEFDEDSPYYCVGPDGITAKNLSHVPLSWQEPWTNSDCFAKPTALLALCYFSINPFNVPGWLLALIALMHLRNNYK